MAKKQSKKMPEYVGWRSEMLSSFVLMRLPELKVYKITDQDTFDKLVMTDNGLCFFIVTRGFSSLAAGLDHVDSDSMWTYSIDTATLKRAREHQSPVFLFYFNADTDHGRYLRLDTLADEDAKELHLPIENAITKASLQKLIRELQAKPKKSKAS